MTSFSSIRTAGDPSHFVSIATVSVASTGAAVSTDAVWGNLDGALFGSVRPTPFAWVTARCSRDLKRQRAYPELLMQTGRVAPRAAAQAQGRGFGWSVQRALFGSVRLIRFRLGRSGGLRDLERQCVPRALLMQGRPRAPPAREWAVAVAVLFGEYKAPLYVVAFRTYEGVVLEGEVTVSIETEPSDQYQTPSVKMTRVNRDREPPR